MAFRLTGHPVIVGALDRVRVRRDTQEVTQLLAEPSFGDQLRQLAERLGRNYPEVRTEAAGYLREMSATHSEAAGEAWQKFGRWLLRAYDVFVDEEAISTLRELDRKHSLVFLPSHRSYLDAWVLPNVALSRGIGPAFAFGGSNLNFFPFGTLASRTGMIFIRRSTDGLPVYRMALRAFIGQLVRNRANLGWAIEGGRTRTGKLRPPRYGILRYVVDAVESVEGPEVLVIPVSIVYDQLHEVSMMTSEARGGRKRPEDLRWLIQFAREQRHRLGRAYLDIGEPLPLRARLAELHGDSITADTHAVERIALDVSHRINRATPVTATAIVSLALLAADRALTLDEVLATVGPLSRYIQGREWPVAGAANLTDRSTIRRSLQEMVASGVLSCYEGGTETVWGIEPEQHLVAAFYRNNAIHILVDRAIGELAVLAAAEAHGDGDPRQIVWAEALRLRELLKFEFFFSARHEFADELRRELSLIDTSDHDDARSWLANAEPRVAHLVLRPFLDAYLMVADRLAAYEDVGFDEARFLDECLRVGRQWVLQHRLASAESVTLELFGTALRLARHRGLVESDEPRLAKRRAEFAEEVREAVRRVAVIAELAKAGTP